MTVSPQKKLVTFLTIEPVSVRWSSAPSAYAVRLFTDGILVSTEPYVKRFEDNAYLTNSLTCLKFCDKMAFQFLPNSKVTNS